MIRLLAHVPEPLLGLAIHQFFLNAPDIRLVAITNNSEAFTTAVSEQEPDVLLVAVPGDVTLDILRRVRRKSAKIKVILWAYEVTVEFAHQAVEFGAQGILRRTLESEWIPKCVRAVHEGEMWFEKSVTQGLLRGRSVRLSKREGDLVSLLSLGLKNKEIATALSISEATVKVYMSKLFAKVGAKDRFELALFGLRNLAQTGSGSEPPRSLFLPRPDFVSCSEREDMVGRSRLMYPA